MTRIFTIVTFGIFLLLSSCGNEKKTNKATSTGDASVDQLNSSISNDPDNAELYFNRAQKFYDKGEYEPAITDLNKAMSIDSLVPKYYHLLSDAQMDYYKSRDALNTMELAARRFPDRIPTLLKLSELQYILNQNDNSIFTLNDILRLNPRENEAFFMLGLNFRFGQDLDRAINSFQTAVEIDPEMVDAWLMLGELYEQKDPKKAITYYDNALRVAPNSPEALHSKAFFLQNNNDVDGAIDIYKQIISKNKQYESAYLNAGILYAQMDSIDKAYEQFNILIGIKPQNPLGHLYRGKTQISKGNYDEAIVDLKNALNLDPENEDALEALELVSNLKAEG